MIIENALVMNIMRTQNGFDITKEMVENSLKSFDHTPIVYNPQGGFNDYTYENKTFPIGVILEPAHIENDGVYSKIFIWEGYENLWHGEYDNWCIVFNEDKKSFVVDSIEVF